MKQAGNKRLQKSKSKPAGAEMFLANNMVLRDNSAVVIQRDEMNVDKLLLNQFNQPTH